MHYFATHKYLFENGTDNESINIQTISADRRYHMVRINCSFRDGRLSRIKPLVSPASNDDFHISHNGLLNYDALERVCPSSLYDWRVILLYSI